jgi:hypothetical protein
LIVTPARRQQAFGDGKVIFCRVQKRGAIQSKIGTFTQLLDQTVEAALDGTMTLGTSLKVLESQIRSAIAEVARHVILNMQSLS